MNYLTLFGAYKTNWSYTGKCTYILLKAETMFHKESY